VTAVVVVLICCIAAAVVAYNQSNSDKSGEAVVAQRVDTQVTSTSASVTATSAASGDEGVEMEDKI